MSDAPKKRKALILQSFEDAGTLEKFTAGDTPLIEIGAFGNYEAAGLVRAPDTADDKPASDQTKAAEPKR